MPPVARTDRAGRSGREQHVELGFAPLAALQMRTDVRAGVRVPNDELVSDFFAGLTHTTRVTAGCDSQAPM